MYNCAKCFQRGCTKQDMTKTLPECPSKDAQIQEEAKALYKEPENYKIAYCAALTEAGGYCQDTRLVEIIKFMHRAGYKKIGEDEHDGQQNKTLTEVVKAVATHHELRQSVSEISHLNSPLCTIKYCKLAGSESQWDFQ